MSSKKNSIDVLPREGDSVNNTENFTFKGYECPCCHGRKEFYEQIGYNQFETTLCPVCCGKGKVKADVVIKWSPDE